MSSLFIMIFLSILDAGALGQMAWVQKMMESSSIFQSLGKCLWVSYANITGSFVVQCVFIVLLIICQLEYNSVQPTRAYGQ